MMMNYNHPIPELARNFTTSPPRRSPGQGAGQVPVKANQPVRQGDVLFRLDAVPFQEKVASLTARLTPTRISSKPSTPDCAPPVWTRIAPWS